MNPARFTELLSARLPFGTDQSTSKPFMRPVIALAWLFSSVFIIAMYIYLSANQGAIGGNDVFAAKKESNQTRKHEVTATVRVPGGGDLAPPQPVALDPKK